MSQIDGTSELGNSENILTPHLEERMRIGLEDYSKDEYELVGQTGEIFNWRSKKSQSDFQVWFDPHLAPDDEETNQEGNEKSRLFVVPANSIEDLKATRTSLEVAYPNRKFKIFSVSGSSAVIYYDVNDPTSLYKVDRPDDKDIDNEEDILHKRQYKITEVFKLHELSKRGIAAKITKFIPDREMSKEELGTIDKTILSDTSSSESIMELERIHNQGIEVRDLPVDFRRKEYDRILGELLELGWKPLDVELIYDAKKNRIVFIDAGGFNTGKKDGLMGPLNDEIKWWLKHHMNI